MGTTTDYRVSTARERRVRTNADIQPGVSRELVDTMKRYSTCYSNSGPAVSALVQNRAQGRFLKFQVNSTYGAYGGLQFLGLTGRNTNSPGYKVGYKDKLNNRVNKYSYCEKDGEGTGDWENRQIEHCQKLSYIVEGNTISTRCPGNCACCKSGANSKTSKTQYIIKL